jgi:transcriptional regulator with XRE-family HTH domain
MKLKLGASKWVHEMAGKVKATRFTQHQSEFLTLLMLKQVKETKEYRLEYGMNWEEFCEYVGVKRRTIDEQLQDLEPFRVDFLAAFANFIGTDISKIRYLGKALSAESATFDGKNFQICGETIPFDAEHKDEIEAAIYKLLEDLRTQKEESAAQKKAFERVQADSHKTVTKLEKELNRFKKIAEGRGLKPEEEAFQSQMNHFRAEFDGFMQIVDPEYIKECPENEIPHTPRMIADYLSTIDYMRKQILAALDTAIDIFGSAAIAPEEMDWTPPPSKNKE